MSERETRVVTLTSYANGTAITEANFGIETRKLPELSEGQLLLQTLVLSPEPYMRGRMTGLDTFYIPQLRLNETITGFGVARVIASKNPRYEAGQVVHGVIEWAEYSVWSGGDKTGLSFVASGDDSGLKAISIYAKPYARALDVIGDTGMTAYFGVTEVIKPMPNETVVISSAAGSVGSIAGQIAKIRGATVVGITGSDEKCRAIVEKLGFDAAVNYKSATFAEDLRAATKKAPDVYIDNVGGSVSQTVMLQMNWPGRVLEIGQISTYDDEGGGWKMDLRPIHDNCLQFNGYHPFRFIDYFPGAKAQLGHWLETGRIKALDTVYHGIENAPKAFAGLLRGANTGKMLIQLAD